MPVYQRLLVRAGFGVQEECRQRIWRRGRSRLRGDIFPFGSARILRSSLPRESASGPLRVSSVGHRARSRGRSGVMPRRAAVIWITGPVPHNGTPIVRPGGLGLVSWR
jgi:hypothetical protein